MSASPLSQIQIVANNDLEKVLSYSSKDLDTNNWSFLGVQIIKNFAQISKTEDLW